jgi:hypothetical protein
MKLPEPAIIAVMGLVTVVVGCSHQPAPTPEALARQTRAFLQPGKVSEEDLLFRYGAPTGRFEGDRIFTWRLGRLNDNLGPVSRVRTGSSDRDMASWYGCIFNLVVEFDGQRVLKHYQLISTPYQ